MDYTILRRYSQKFKFCNIRHAREPKPQLPTAYNLSCTCLSQLLLSILRSLFVWDVWRLRLLFGYRSSKMAPKCFTETTNYQTSMCNISEERITELRRGGSLDFPSFNPLNTELKPICHLLTLLGAYHIFHVSGLRVNFIHVMNLLRVALHILCILDL
jgi:hypothetical protein